MPLPKILVTGFANSGTSFMCELVASMGFSAGTRLKGGDEHNPFGYWEHLPIRDMVWGRVGNFNERRIPDRPVDPSRWPSAISMMQDAARQDHVEVYKDCTGPWSYPLLASIERVVVITRDVSTLYERYYTDWSFAEFSEVHSKYHDLADDMSFEIPTMMIGYEDFSHDIALAIGIVCRFLGQPYDHRLTSVFRPRERR